MALSSQGGTEGLAVSLIYCLQHLDLSLQARGRARAENSVYSVLAKANTREVTRELLNEDLVELMKRAIQAVQAMPEQEYFQKVGGRVSVLLCLREAEIQIPKSWDGVV